MLRLAAIAGVIGLLFVFAAMGAIGATPEPATSGGFAPNANLGLNPAQLAQAARALRTADTLHAQPLPVLAMVVAALGESGFEAIPNKKGSGYCGVFQADPDNIPCDDTEQQATYFQKGGKGFQAGGAIRLARTVSDPGQIANLVEAGNAGAAHYNIHRPQAERIIAAWHSSGLATTGEVAGTPKQIIDTVVLPLAAQAGIHRTVAENDAANATHGPTVTGGLSDHQGPPEQRWAADMSNGRTTPEEDKLAALIARRFGIDWHGAGAMSNPNFHGYRVQLIYRSFVGGDHFNHVHCGIAVVSPVIWASPQPEPNGKDR